MIALSQITTRVLLLAARTSIINDPLALYEPKPMKACCIMASSAAEAVSHLVAIAGIMGFPALHLVALQSIKQRS